MILYAFHTHRHIRSKFPNDINSIYLSEIYEEIIHQFSYVGFVLRHKRLCYHGGLEAVDSQHIDSEGFTSLQGTLIKFRLNIGQWGQFFVSVVSCNQFSLRYQCNQSVLYRLMKFEALCTRRTRRRTI